MYFGFLMANFQNEPSLMEVVQQQQQQSDFNFSKMQAVAAAVIELKRNTFERLDL